MTENELRAKCVFACGLHNAYLPSSDMPIIEGKYDFEAYMPTIEGRYDFEA